jgi:hypothetical protein
VTRGDHAMRLAFCLSFFSSLSSPLIIILHQPSSQNLRRVAVGAAKLQNQVGVGALVEDRVLATGVARRVGVGAVAGGARRARDAEAVAGAAGEELEALALEGVAEDGGQVVVGAVRVGADVVDGLQRAAKVGLAGDGERGLLHVGAGDGGGEGGVLVGGQGDDAAGGVALLGLQVQREVALVVDEDLGGGGRGGETKAGEHEGGEVHVGGWLLELKLALKDCLIEGDVLDVVW